METGCQAFIRNNIARWYHPDSSDPYQIPTKDLQKIFQLSHENLEENGDYSQKDAIIAEITKEAFLYQSEMNLIENSKNLNDKELPEKVLRIAFLQTGLEFEEPLLSSKVGEAKRIERISQKIFSMNPESKETHGMTPEIGHKHPSSNSDLSELIKKLNHNSSSQSILASKSKDNPFETKRRTLILEKDRISRTPSADEKDTATFTTTEARSLSEF